MKEQQQGNQTEEGCGWQKQNEVQLEVHRAMPTGLLCCALPVPLDYPRLCGTSR